MAVIRNFPLVICLAATALAAVPSADAAPRRGGQGPAPDYVVAESRFGNGTVAGYVRPGRRGWEVRLPGGSWVPCGRDCAERLRVETVDFWENRGPNRIDNEAGIFGDLTFRRRF